MRHINSRQANIALRHRLCKNVCDDANFFRIRIGSIFFLVDLCLCVVMMMKMLDDQRESFFLFLPILSLTFFFSDLNCIQKSLGSEDR